MPLLGAAVTLAGAVAALVGAAVKLVGAALALAGAALALAGAAVALPWRCWQLRGGNEENESFLAPPIAINLANGDFLHSKIMEPGS